MYVCSEKCSNGKFANDTMDARHIISKITTMNAVNGVGTTLDKFVIETEFRDTLTSNSCTTLITEIIKYILYHKQQLPYTFDRLKYVVGRKRAVQGVESHRNIALTNNERLFKIAEEGFKNLEVLFEKTKQEIMKSDRVSEIALLFGNSPLAPKQVYHIHLPQIYCNHQLQAHSDKKYLIQFLQSVIQSSKLNEMLMKPMGPTNMYVFIKKFENINTDNICSWFLPKNRFQVPTNGQHFHIKLKHPQFENRTCVCHGLGSNFDNNAERTPKLSTSTASRTEKCEISKNRDEKEVKWYQACTVFKGFKDVFVNGVSVSESWMRSAS